jgi:hypothetical protein
MEVTKYLEAGYEPALIGMSLSFKDRAVPLDDWSSTLDREHYHKVLIKNAPRDGGHNKFLEHLIVWLDIEAPRYWWSEFDTYRPGVSKQSESTIHTLNRRDITLDDLDIPPDVGDWSLNYYKEIAYNFSDARYNNTTLQVLKGLVPESYKQRREVVLSYKTLRSIFLQRKNHRLPEWRVFINSVKSLVDYPEFLPHV